MPRVHAVALNTAGTAAAFGCADSRAFACALPPLEDEAGEDRLPAIGAGAPRAGAVIPPGGVAFGEHLSDVTAVAWFPSDRVLLTGGSDLRLRVFDVASGACAATLAGHAGGIAGVTIIERGRHVASVARDSTLKLWSVPEKRVVASVALPAMPNGLALLGGQPLPALAASVGPAGGAPPSDAHPPTGPAPAPAETAPAAGKLFAVACDDGTLALVDGHSMSLVASPPLVPTVASGSVAGGTTPLSSEPGSASEADVHPAGGSSATVGAAASAAISPAAAPPAAQSYESGHKALCVATLARRSLVAAGGSDGHVAVWDVASLFDRAGNKWVASPPAVAGVPSSGIATSPSVPAATGAQLLWHGQLVGTGAEVLSLQLFDAADLQPSTSSEAGCVMSAAVSSPAAPAAITAGGLYALAGLSDGTCGIFPLIAASAPLSAPPLCPVTLSGPLSDAVRSVSARVKRLPAAPATATAVDGETDSAAVGSGAEAAGAVVAAPQPTDAYLTIATACNDGFARAYQLPLDIVARTLGLLLPADARGISPAAATTISAAPTAAE
jgi:WD40 repeat protein